MKRLLLLAVLSMFTLGWVPSVNYCLQFDGALGAYMYIPHHKEIDLGTESFAIMWWMRADETGHIFGKKSKNGSGHKMMEVGINSDEELYFFVKGTGHSRLQVISDDPTIIGFDWRHYALHLDRKNKAAQIYIDGNLAAEKAIETNLGNLNMDGDFRIGQQVGQGVPFTGGIDNFAIYKGLSEWQFQWYLWHNCRNSLDIAWPWKHHLVWGSIMDDGEGEVVTNVLCHNQHGFINDTEHITWYRITR